MNKLLLLLFAVTLLFSYDATTKIKLLGEPYKLVYETKKNLYAKNIWDMAIFENKIYFGAGNSSNEGPTQNAGPVPLISYNPTTNEFKTEAIIQDEQIDVIKIFNNKMYIPGHDARENWDFANFYIKESNQSVKKYRNIKDGLHVYDVAFRDNKIFLALGVRNGAAVAISTDNAQNWEIQKLNHYRVNSFLEVGNRLFAIKHFPSSSDLQKMSQSNKNFFFSVAEYENNREFVPNYKLNAQDFFPKTTDLKDKSRKIVRSAKMNDKTIYIGAYAHNDHQFEPFGVYYISSAGKNLDVKKIALSNQYKVWDILKKENTLYLLAYDESKKEVKVFFTKNGDFESFKEYFSFKSETFARSFELFEDKFYFSLGGEFKDSKNFSYDEISEDIGKVLQFDTKNITN
ncbi:MAG: hypothetical protein NTZ60_02010 [Campylobacterales bacterium]|nr:hypothetical protein [Campylobacterales bacterium]